jgi:hypothetical protein
LIGKFILLFILFLPEKRQRQTKIDKDRQRQTKTDKDRQRQTKTDEVKAIEPDSKPSFNREINDSKIIAIDYYST